MGKSLLSAYLVKKSNDHYILKRNATELPVQCPLNGTYCNKFVVSRFALCRLHFTCTCTCTCTCGCAWFFLSCVFTEPSGPPTDVIILASGPSTLTVSWSPPLINPEVVLEYFIRCAQQSDPSNSQTTSRRNFVTSAPFHNLIPNTAYKCEVHTTSTFGNSTSARASATTPPRESKYVYMYVSI